MTAALAMKFPAKTITGRPIWAALTIITFFWLATVVFAQTQNASSIGSTSIEDVFRIGGWVLMIIALLTIAASAVFNVFRKAALQEAVSLAATRKEKLIEVQLDNAKKDARIKELEAENESLEKKNLRLQDGK